ncbi:rod-binding protein [Thalassomonas actiniarum]|uniref:Rod-binding protein n=1 Tax=Thalassomonas actiniarum TaxID=485447 RepID=A0AAE9YR38_9GAMM|nr:rod-binding protein [Thalassomonas actiniarum]WDD99316.1 rod-binding protein [Thalassomonas actiniarum]
MTKITDAGIYLDPKAINSIKENTNKAEGLEQAADQFETLFLQMVLKSMRDASDALSDEDSLVSSKQERMYRDMYDGQLTMAMINKGSIGIADAMVKQLSPAEKAGEANPVATPEKNKSDDQLKSAANTVANQEVSHDAFRQPLLQVNTMNKINKSGAS